MFNKKTVAGICNDFTAELEKVRDQQLEVRNKEAKVAAEAKARSDQAAQEANDAITAIGNIRSLFGRKEG